MLSASSLAFVVKGTNNTSTSFRVCSDVETFPSASNSVILSMAAYLTWKYPNLIHPLYPEIEIPIEREPLTDNYVKKELSFHPLFEAWCDLMVKAVENGYAKKVESTLFVAIEISETYADYLNSLEFVSEVHNSDIDLDKIFKLCSILAPKKKIILCNLATSQLRENPHLPKIHIPALLIGTIYNNDEWKLYNVLKGEYPSKSELMEADAIILPGSSNSVLEKIEPVDNFVSELVAAYGESSKLRIMSICYGIQLISKIHGSEVVRKNRYKGHEDIKFDQEKIEKYDFLRHISQNPDKEWIMPEHHEDYVLGAPNGFDLIATSSSCYVEAIVKHDQRILGFQFHPEYFHEYTVAFTERLKKANTQYHSCFELDLAEEKIKGHIEACTLVRMCMKEFLNGN